MDYVSSNLRLFSLRPISLVVDPKCQEPTQDHLNNNYMSLSLCVRGNFNTFFEEGGKSKAEAGDADLGLHAPIFWATGDFFYAGMDYEQVGI